MSTGEAAASCHRLFVHAHPDDEASKKTRTDRGSGPRAGPCVYPYEAFTLAGT